MCLNIVTIESFKPHVTAHLISVVSRNLPQKVPGHTDFVIAHSTVAGFYSWRNTVQGSWYIQAMTRVFAKERQERDLLSMLTNVNKVRKLHRLGSRQRSWIFSE